MPNPPRGLTTNEVDERRLDGRVNRTARAVTKPFSRIVFDNVCTVFNLFNTLIAVALIAVGSYHNLLFFGVVLCNTAIGVFQECRSKKALENLSLLADAKASVRRDGQEYRIASQDIVEDDILFLQQGDQLLTDAVMLEGGYLEVNESLLTGEADAVQKRGGDTLLSGSFVVSGNAYARVTNVGSDSYAARLTAQAKTYKRLQSQLYRSMDKIIRFTSLFLIPFGILLVVRDAFGNAPFDLAQTVTSTAAALIGMMPQGLILLTTVSLSVGVVKLAKQQTLVRELYCIETLSRVSLLCLDKTGTLTNGDLRVREVLPLSDDVDSAAVDTLIASAVFAIGDQNATALALRNYYGDTVPAKSARSTVPFSSERKWSSATFENGRTVFLGAPDRLLAESAVPKTLKTLTHRGDRVLLAAVGDGDGAK
ncbi:MAG: HAD-IC family P-type ATPase, partial [Clostridia bacterium]|nr:HAD-IC family P-type ATPase [Clostridia bacterium]